jgi:hypothetical protein
MKSILSLFAILALVGGGSLSSHGQPAGQWDFDSGNLNATVGSPLTYRDGAGGATQGATAFNTTTGFGIPDIGGQVADVIRVPGVTNDFATGFNMPVPNEANAGGSLLNDYTLILDILFPEASAGKQRALIETDLGFYNPDSDFFVNANNTVGRKGDNFGSLAANTWYRLGIVVDATAGELRFYVDGAEVGVVRGQSLVDQRYALNPGVQAELFADDSGEVAQAYVNSIQLRTAALSKGQMLALGAATAEGLPEELPPVPSSVERWIPPGQYASRTTSIGAVINPGDTTIQDNSISLLLDNNPVTSPVITRADGLITVEKTDPGLSLGAHTLVVAFTDSLAGERRITNNFTAALFFEDFEGVTLEPQKEETTAIEDPVWTHDPPEGWSVDNSDFPAVVIDPVENPDGDGDGYADQDGRTEWAGWSFARKDFWVAADDQRRSEFAFAQGVVAVADPDEWDDSSHLQSLYNSSLSTPQISLEGLAPNSVFLAFSSSWRPEGMDDTGSNFPTGPNGEAINNQTAQITASFDGGEPVEVMKWDSTPGGPTFHTDLPNESVLVSVPNPQGATNLVLTFSMLQAANDWWWAIDNVAVSSGGAPPVITQQPLAIEVNEDAPATLSVTATGEGVTYQWFKGQGGGKTAVAGATSASYSIPSADVADAGYYSVELSNSTGTAVSAIAKLTVIPTTQGRTVLLDENFDSLTLGPNVDEGVAGDEVWTKTGPEGWSIDDAGVPGAGTDQDGVTEWAGWSFADREWWAETAGDQQRSAFVKGTGTSAIADSDEWDDIAHAEGNMATYLSTRPISLEGVGANSVILKFDSSWRPEAAEKANVTVRFGGGDPVEVLRFESDPNSASYRPDEVNETVALRINNPEGATNMVVTFGYFDTRNNWWWAIDNVLVLAGDAGGDEPELAFTVANNQLTLTWTGDGFVLEENANVANAAGWTAVAGVTGNSATVPLTEAARFYRLRM